MTGAAIAAAGISAAAAGGSAASASSSSAAARKQNEDIMKAIYTGSHQEMTPYRKLGKQAAAGYQAGMPGWADTAQYQQYMQPYTQEQYRQSPLYTPMVNSLAELQATPGYQFQLQQGQQNLAQQAAARGGLLSGAQMKAAQGYGQQQAATGFQQAWQRAQDAYTKAFNQNLAQQGQYGNLLMGANQQAANIYNTGVNTGLTAVQAPYSLASGMAAPMMQSNMANAAAQGQSALGIGAGIGNVAGSIYGAGKDAGWFGNVPSGSSQLSTAAPGYISPGGPRALY